MSTLPAFAGDVTPATSAPDSECAKLTSTIPATIPVHVRFLPVEQIAVRPVNDLGDGSASAGLVRNDGMVQFSSDSPVLRDIVEYYFTDVAKTRCGVWIKFPYWLDVPNDTTQNVEITTSLEKAKQWDAVPIQEFAIPKERMPVIREYHAVVGSKASVKGWQVGLWKSDGNAHRTVLAVFRDGAKPGPALPISILPLEAQALQSIVDIHGGAAHVVVVSRGLNGTIYLFRYFWVPPDPP